MSDAIEAAAKAVKSLKYLRATYDPLGVSLDFQRVAAALSRTEQPDARWWPSVGDVVVWPHNRIEYIVGTVHPKLGGRYLDPIVGWRDWFGGEPKGDMCRGEFVRRATPDEMLAAGLPVTPPSPRGHDGGGGVGSDSPVALDIETTCPRCHQQYADHLGDETECVCPPRPVTPGEERGVDREAVEAAAMAEYVAASLAWWLDDSDEAGNFDGPSWQRYWNAYYSLPVEVRRGAK